MAHLILAVIYLSFISLGLPDALLGAAWPSMYREFGVPVSYAGRISTIICVMTICSSLMSDRATRKFGAGKVTAFSVLATAAALFGFSASRSYWELCLWAVPYGLGAGSVDAALNNYVALHYKSYHMSWLHCMWGIGASAGPYIMGLALSGGYGWNKGYLAISGIQAVLAFAVFMSLPLWKKGAASGQQEEQEAGGKAKKPLGKGQVLCTPGVLEAMVSFTCYSALEATAGLWASSYLVMQAGLSEETAAACAGLFYLGITAGRAVSGFLTFILQDRQMIRLGGCVAGLGFLVLLGEGAAWAQAGLFLIGLGCAPVYPCMIHSTPVYFGAEKSQSIIGLQMASAYVGSSTMPLAFGFLAEHAGVSLYPFFLLALLILMMAIHERLQRKTKAAFAKSVPA